MTPGESTPDFVSSSKVENQKPKSAWQPVTPRGVAAFAQATFGRLLLVELIVALLTAAAVVWFLAVGLFPTVRQAIGQLPEQGAIRNRQLISPRISPQPLAESHILALVVDVANQSQASLASDIRVEFHKNNYQICSLFGCLVFPYPRGYTVEFNRPELEPWWGAWEPIILGMVAIAVVAVLMLIWAVLATFYFVFVRLLAFFKDRDANWGGSWRLASAALIPGTFLLIAAVVLYGLEIVDLILFLLLVLLHLPMGWIYLLLSVSKLPRTSGAPSPANPFAAPSSEPKQNT